MQVSVRLSKDQSLTFEVAPTESLRALKSRVELATGVPMNRLHLSLAGEEVEDGLVSTLVARAAAQVPRLKTKAVIALLREGGHEAVKEMLLETATFNAMVDVEPEHLARLHEHKLSPRSCCGSCLSTSASESSFSLSSFTLDSFDIESGLSSSDFTKAEDEYSLDVLVRENELRANNLRFLLAERQSRLR